ncbi:MAG: hypothetical protein Q4C60_02065 [Eubacteriales bacterium]|nr:hypothetical protein [Eubacteriales bacterium]
MIYRIYGEDVKMYHKGEAASFAEIWGVISGECGELFTPEEIVSEFFGEDVVSRVKQEEEKRRKERKGYTGSRVMPFRLRQLAGTYKTEEGGELPYLTTEGVKRAAEIYNLQVLQRIREKNKIKEEMRQRNRRVRKGEGENAC